MGGGGGGEGEGERAGLAGLVERGLAEDEAGFADGGGGGAEATWAEVAVAASWDGAGDGECTSTGIEMGTDEGPDRF